MKQKKTSEVRCSEIYWYIDLSAMYTIKHHLYINLRSLPNFVLRKLKKYNNLSPLVNLCITYFHTQSILPGV